MPRPYLPDNFRTSIAGTHTLVVKSKEGEFLMGYDLEALAADLLNGTCRARSPQSAAGAAIVHLLATLKGAK
jgi:hypothetical protein